jgi:hypothetical protein
MRTSKVAGISAGCPSIGRDYLDLFNHHFVLTTPA